MLSDIPEMISRADESEIITGGGVRAPPPESTGGRRGNRYGNKSRFGGPKLKVRAKAGRGGGNADCETLRELLKVQENWDALQDIITSLDAET